VSSTPFTTSPSSSIRDPGLVRCPIFSSALHCCLSVTDLASALQPSLVLFSQLCDIFAGITLSKSVEDGTEGLVDPSSQIHMWSLSPALSSDSLEATLRSTLFSCSTWLLSLHSISNENSAVLGLLGDGDERLATLRSFRLQMLLRVISDLPLFDVRSPPSHGSQPTSLPPSVSPSLRR
jgi:hypothetical protein